MDPTKRILLKVDVPNAGGDTDERRDAMDTRNQVEDLMGPQAGEALRLHPVRTPSLRAISTSSRLRTS